VRKADLLGLKAELTRAQDGNGDLATQLKTKDGEIKKLRDEVASSQRELTGEKRVTKELTEERTVRPSWLDLTWLGLA
jgi:predicted RNase H-like nuclease (RuvC/YqgF family)